MSVFSNILNGVNSILQPYDSLGIMNGVTTAVNGINAERQHQSDLDWSSAQADKNRAFQTSERIAAQEYNEDMWNKQNEYNSPENQLKLAMAAGINPNMAISGVVGNGFARNAPFTSPMSGNMAGFPNSFASSMLQAQQLAATARKTEAEATGKEIENSYAPSFNNQAIRKAEAEIEELAAKKGFTEEQTRQMKELFPLLKDKNEQELEKLKADIKISVQQLEKLKADTDLANEELELAKWKNDFREQFGVAPDSGLIDGLIQLLTAGDQAQSLAMSMFDTVFSVAVGSLKGLWNNVISKPVRAVYELGSLIKSGQFQLLTADGVPIILNP